MEILVRKKRKPMADINVVPYIDVMQVLLIVFMVTAPMLNQGIEVDLPQANNEPVDIDENRETLVVSIKADGSYFLSIGATGEEAQNLELSVLGDQVRRVVDANPDIQVLIEGDREADWGTQLHFWGTFWTHQKNERIVMQQYFPKATHMMLKRSPNASKMRSRQQIEKQKSKSKLQTPGVPDCCSSCLRRPPPPLPPNKKKKEEQTKKEEVKTQQPKPRDENR